MRVGGGSVLLRRLAASFGREHELYLPHGRLGFARRYLAWRWRSQFGPRPRLAAAARFTAVVLSYRRPENIRPILRGLLRCPFVARVVVGNNDPGTPLSRRVGIADPRVTIVDRADNGGTLVRFEIARAEPCRHFLVVDDDLFLDPAQLAKLAAALLAEPGRVHGAYAQVENDRGGFDDAIHGVEREVAILNRVFAFTADHVREFFELYAALGLDGDPSPLRRVAADDIVLSRCGTAPPVCHDIGEILDCPTEGLPGIAVWRQLDFAAYRAELYRRVGAIKRFGETSATGASSNR